MHSNTFGHILQLTTFGESHGKAMGGIITGFPAGIDIDVDFIQQELDKRKPGQSSLTTSRNESDAIQILSGVMNGKSLGTPIGFIIPNADQQSKDYDVLKDVFRPSHADYTYEKKYGIRDHRGGGRSSARETVCRVAGGAFAKHILQLSGIDVHAYVHQISNIHIPENATFNLSETYHHPVRCPHKATADQMEAAIQQAKQSGDTLGGIISVVISGVPAGLGQPVFAKLNADLAHACMGINAVKGVEFGGGFDMASKQGSEVNDRFVKSESDGSIQTQTNYSDGIQGGISNGMEIRFNVAFKPVATIQQPIETIDKEGNAVVMEAKGRHDPCVLPRAAIIVESMSAWVLADHYLWSGLDNWDKIKKLHSSI